MADNNLFIEFFFRGMRTRPIVILPPAVVEILAKAGYSRSDVKRHFYEFYQGIEQGNWPEQIGRTKELDREVQMVSSPDDFQVVISGDPGRDHVLICAQNGFMGYPVCKKIQLPHNWDALLAQVNDD